MPDDGMLHKLADITKLQGLGWKYKIELDEGVRLAYEWIKENVDFAECAYNSIAIFDIN